jgi:hypothetical protein
MINNHSRFRAPFLRLSRNIEDNIGFKLGGDLLFFIYLSVISIFT